MTLKQAIIIGLFDEIQGVTANIIYIKSKSLQNYFNGLDFIKDDDYFCLDFFSLYKDKPQIEFAFTVNVMNDKESMKINYNTMQIYA